MEALRLLNEFYGLIIVVLTVAGTMAVIWLKGRFPTRTACTAMRTEMRTGLKATLDEHTAQIDDHEARIAKVENVLPTLPTAEMVIQILVSQAELKGSIDTVNATMGGVRNNLDLLMRAHTTDGK